MYIAPVARGECRTSDLYITKLVNFLSEIRNNVVMGCALILYCEHQLAGAAMMPKIIEV